MVFTNSCYSKIVKQKIHINESAITCTLLQEAALQSYYINNNYPTSTFRVSVYFILYISECHYFAHAQHKISINFSENKAMFNILHKPVVMDP